MGARHDPAVALRLIYMTFTRVLGWRFCSPGPTPPRRSRSWSCAASSPYSSAAQLDHG